MNGGVRSNTSARLPSLSDCSSLSASGGTHLRQRRQGAVRPPAPPRQKDYARASFELHCRHSSASTLPRNCRQKSANPARPFDGGCACYLFTWWPVARVPLATYRLQFNSGFTFRDALAVVDYLHDLGISDCYASSYLKAVPGSPHGYDVADPTRLNPEIGTDEEYWAWIDALHARGMGHVLDLVPNHMGIAKSANPWWLDVLENGPSSRFARFFDIEWRPVKDELADKVLIPILGDQYGAVLERQELQLAYRDGAFCRPLLRRDAADRARHLRHDPRRHDRSMARGSRRAPTPTSCRAS